jgi:hypothetical protein
MGLFALSTLLVAGAGVYLLSKAFPNYQPGNKKIQADLKMMREEMKAIADDLIPLSPKELELISLQTSDTTSKKGFVKNYKGKIQTIFHESVAGFYYRQYISRGKSESALLFIQMLDQQYYYWIKPKEIRVVVNDQFLGVIKDHTKIYAGKKETLKGYINKDKEDYWPIIVEDREVAGFATGAGGGNKNLTQRAYEYVASELSREEKAVLLAFTFLEIVHHQVN